jgi:hypothetical protein
MLGTLGDEGDRVGGLVQGRFIPACSPAPGWTRANGRVSRWGWGWTVP